MIHQIYSARPTTFRKHGASMQGRCWISRIGLPVLTNFQGTLYSSRSGFSRIYEIGHVTMELERVQSIPVQIHTNGVEMIPHVKYSMKIQINCLGGKNIEIESEIQLRFQKCLVWSCDLVDGFGQNSYYGKFNLVGNILLISGNNPTLCLFLEPLDTYLPLVLDHFSPISEKSRVLHFSSGTFSTLKDGVHFYDGKISGRKGGEVNGTFKFQLIQGNERPRLPKSGEYEGRISLPSKSEYLMLLVLKFQPITPPPGPDMKCVVKGREFDPSSKHTCFNLFGKMTYGTHRYMGYLEFYLFEESESPQPPRNHLLSVEDTSTTSPPSSPPVTTETLQNDELLQMSLGSWSESEDSLPRK